MKKSYFAGVDRKDHKKVLFSAVAMLLVASVLMVTTSYAWLVISTAPEVTGISTNIAANGSLEITLLNERTRSDFDSITSGTGNSLATNKTSANNTWGNLVDLHDSSYGLQNITLLPSRLNMTLSQDGSYVVDTSLLSIPTYGYDGRVVDVTGKSITGAFENGAFMTALASGATGYGVRAVGTSDTLTPQDSALALAKTNITSYTKSAKNTAAAALSANGSNLLNLLLVQYTGSGEYNDTHVAVIRTIVGELDLSVSYIENAIRQGVVARAASQIEDSDKFELARDSINAASDIAQLLDTAGEYGVVVPEEVNEWIDALETTRNRVNLASTRCDALTGGVYSWDQIKAALEPIMNMDQVYIGDSLFSNMSQSDLMDMLGSVIKISLPSGSGVLADIADFAGNYTGSFTAMGSNVEITTLSSISTPRLTTLSVAVAELSAAGGGVGDKAAELDTTYGYALDLAFRTNAPNSNLLLQTSGVQRVYSESTSASTLGGGSYMEFELGTDGYTLEQLTELMDAIRVTFLDDQNKVLGIAKLNLSNRELNEEGTTIKAPLYLYDFSISTNTENLGALVMGERQTTANVLTSLQQNVAKAVTVLVWLDGDLVDNTMVPSTAADAPSGTLNLQFASSAALTPAGNNDLMNLTTDKTQLAAGLETAKDLYEAGQQDYTTESWTLFAKAYSYAEEVNNSETSSETQVYWASDELVKAYRAMETVDAAALSNAIASYRELMGSTEEDAVYVMAGEEGEIFTTASYTEAAASGALGTIKSVDYNKNLNDEGNGTYTLIYSESSWENLAAALYQAEALYEYGSIEPGKYATADIDAAITALSTAYAALEREIYYIPYDYNGTLYYKSLVDADKADTYGTWYDYNFKRVVSDLTILKLDAYAVPATIASIYAPSYIPYGTESFSASIGLVNYVSMMNDTITGTNWTLYDSRFTRTVDRGQVTALTDLLAEYDALVEVYPDTTTISCESARDFLWYFDGDDDTVSTGSYKNAVYEDANTHINTVAAAIAEIEAAVAEANATAAKADDAVMTLEKRTLLTKAISLVKALDTYVNGVEADAEGYEDYLTMVAAVGAAEAALAEEAPTTTNVGADELLADLNAWLETPVTAANTIVYTLPGSAFDVVNACDIAYACFRSAAEDYSVTSAALSALIITDRGVVTTVSHTLNFYLPAEELQVGAMDTDDIFGTEELDTYDLEAGNDYSLSAYLRFSSDGRFADDGNATCDFYSTADGTTRYYPVPADTLFHGYDTEDVTFCLDDLALQKSVQKVTEGTVYTWASSDPTVAKVTGTGNDVTLVCLQAGEVEISLSVVTYAGTWTVSYPVVVAAAETGN